METRTKPSGFTLLELMVAMALLSVFLVLASIIVGNTSNLSNDCIGRSRTEFSARSALDFVAGELRRIVVPLASQGRNGPRLLIAPPTTLTGAGAALPHSLFWQMVSDTPEEEGNLTTAGYFVRWNMEGNVFDPVLCRIAEPVVPAEASSPKEYGEPSGWLSEELLDTLAPATKIEDFQGLFADKILALWCRALDAYGNPISKNALGVDVGYAFDSSQGYRDSAGGVYPGPALPAAIEIALVVSETRALGRLADAPSKPVAYSPSDLRAEIDEFVESLPRALQEQTRVYSRVIHLPQSP